MRHDNKPDGDKFIKIFGVRVSPMINMGNLAQVFLLLVGVIVMWVKMDSRQNGTEARITKVESAMEMMARTQEAGALTLARVVTIQEMQLKGKISP